jgi:general secretion pathway protein H
VAVKRLTPIRQAHIHLHNETTHCKRRLWSGFTLLELLVVIAIIGLATAAVTLAMRPNVAGQLEQEAERLAALLEAARGRSRLSGVPIVWRSTPQGFVFESSTADLVKDLPKNWLSSSASIQVLSEDSNGQLQANNQAAASLRLGPEPIIAAQSVRLQSRDESGQALATRRVFTNGLQSFASSAVNES